MTGSGLDRVFAGVPVHGTLIGMAKKLKRPRDPVQLAKMIGDIATGQVEDAKPDDGKNPAAVALGKLGGQKGGKARASSLSSSERSVAARRAAAARWKGSRKD